MTAKPEAPALDGITQQLRAEESRLVAEQAELDSRCREASRELRRVRSALSALGAKSDPRGRKEASNATSTAEAVEGIMHVLAARDAIPIQELRVLVQQWVKAAGKSLIGFHLRFASALRDQRFEVCDGVCRRSGGAGANATSRPDPAITPLPGIGPISKGSKGGSS